MLPETAAVIGDVQVRGVLGPLASLLHVEAGGGPSGHVGRRRRREVHREIDLHGRAEWGDGELVGAAPEQAGDEQEQDAAAAEGDDGGGEAESVGEGAGDELAERAGVASLPIIMGQSPVEIARLKTF